MMHVIHPFLKNIGRIQQPSLIYRGNIRDKSVPPKGHKSGGLAICDLESGYESIIQTSLSLFHQKHPKGEERPRLSKLNSIERVRRC